MDIGLYSLSNKPHATLVGALIRSLGLNEEKYQQKVYFERHGHQGVTVKYSERVVPLLYEWLKQKNFPLDLTLESAEEGKTKTFKIFYKNCALPFFLPLQNIVQK